MSTVRSVEVALTKEFSGADPVWTNATIHLLTEGATQLTLPVLGSTKYAVRYRKQDVFGNFSDWSTHTEHTTLAGSDSLVSTAADQATTVENSMATVIIDADGLHVFDGAIFIEDEFGATQLTASGFEGTWGDFIRLGLYNPMYLQRDPVLTPPYTIALGRTTNLPYWTVANDAGTPTLTMFATGGATSTGAGIRCTWAAHTTTKVIYSDPVPRSYIGNVRFGVRGVWARSAGTLRIRVYYEVSDDPAFPFSVGSLIESLDMTAASGSFELNGFDTIRDKYMRLVIEFTELTTHNAANEIEIEGAWLLEQPELLGGFTEIGDDGAGQGNLIVNDATDPAVEVSGGFQADHYMGSYPTVEVFTANGTYNKPDDAHHIVVECIGGGGAGGSCQSTTGSESSVAGGGGGGGYARKLFTREDLASDSTYTIVRGAGGSPGAAGNNNGGNGAASTFAGTGITTVSGGGGTGGNGSAANSGPERNVGGDGGSASGGDINVVGSDGVTGVVVRGDGGQGDPGAMGQGGASGGLGGGGGRTSASSGNGVAGNQYGGGGAGGWNANSQASGRTGGAGANGVVIVTTYFAP